MVEEDEGRNIYILYHKQISNINISRDFCHRSPVRDLSLFVYDSVLGIPIKYDQILVSFGYGPLPGCQSPPG